MNLREYKARQRTGKWITKSAEYGRDNFYACSNCKKIVVFTLRIYGVYKYCPYCGARMKGVKGWEFISRE